ncbi:hypothetical protein OAG73_02165, partial [bacterium]|nr:hypothetical protein [bacterium]
PVLAFAPKRSHIYEIINKSRCGFVFDNSEKISIKSIETSLLFLMNDKINLIGNNGQMFLENHFDRQKIIHEFTQRLLGCDSN